MRMSLRALFTRPFRRLASGIVPSQPKDVAVGQSPNRTSIWSNRQRPKGDIVNGPRFTQIDLAAQPNPPAAIEFIKADPIRKVHSRQVKCNGDGVLGHPTVFINLVQTTLLIAVFTLDRIPAITSVAAIVDGNSNRSTDVIKAKQIFINVIA